MDRKDLIKLGATAAALVAIGTVASGVWGFAKPFAQSDPPPYPGMTRVQQEEVEIAGLVQTDRQTQQYLKTMQSNILFLSQQNWTLVQTNAEDQLRKNPNNLAARQQLNTAKQALFGINRQLYGGK